MTQIVRLFSKKHFFKALATYKTAFIISPVTKIPSTIMSESSVKVPSSNLKSNPKLFKGALIGVIVAGVTYWLVRKYR